jgi:tetratricopeptide (TPR) repeat protein
MPLAIELAASRVGALAPSEICERLAEGLDVLKTTLRDVPPRQRSMRAALQWSWGLLAPRERRAMEQLATFHGGFTTTAAEAVLASAGLSDGLDLVDALRRRSLLRRTGAGPARFDLYVAVREFAQEKLEERGARAEAEDHHARYWLARVCAYSGDDQQCSRANAPEVRAMRVDGANLLAARATLLGTDPAAAAHLTLAMEPWTAGRASAALRARLRDEAVAAAREAEEPRTLSQLLCVRAMTRWLDGDVPGAEVDADEAVALSEEHGDPVCEGYAYSTRGVVLLFVDARRDQAQADFARAKELEAAHPDAGLRAYTWIDEGAICSHTGRPAGARDAFREAVKAYREIGATRLEGLPLTFLGGAYADLGQVEEARACLGQALRIQEACDDRQDGSLASCLLGNLEAGEGRWDVARGLGEQALHQADGAGIASSALDARLLLLTIALGTGDHALADACLPSLLETARSLRNQQAEARALWHRAVLHTERGDAAAARADAEAAAALVPIEDPAGGAWATLRHVLESPLGPVEIPAGARGHQAVRRILARLQVPLAS